MIAQVIEQTKEVRAEAESLSAYLGIGVIIAIVFIAFLLIIVCSSAPRGGGRYF